MHLLLDGAQNYGTNIPRLMFIMKHGIDGDENLLRGELLIIVGSMRSIVSVEWIPIGLRTNTLTVSCSNYNLFIYGLTAWPDYSGLV